MMILIEIVETQVQVQVQGIKTLVFVPVLSAVAVRKNVTFHQTFTAIFFYLLDQIKSNCMYLLHWKSEENRTETNELDELKCSKSLNQTISYTH